MTRGRRFGKPPASNEGGPEFELEVIPMDILAQAAEIVRAYAKALANEVPEVTPEWNFQVGSIAPEFDI
jgi:hypothetical protein